MRAERLAAREFQVPALVSAARGQPRDESEPNEVTR